MEKAYRFAATGWVDYTSSGLRSSQIYPPEHKVYLLHHPTRDPSRYATMNDRLTAVIERVRSDESIPALDEANVKQGVILPVLQALGWDPFDIEEVKPEHSVGSRRVDYVLRPDGRNKVFLEAKRPNENLGNHAPQLLDYSFREGVSLAVLTNGLNWWFYLPLREGSWDERRFGVIDLRNQDVSQTADSLIDFLSRENVRSGTAVQHAESHLANLWKARRIDETLPRAWKQLIADPDDLLLVLLNEKVKELCGWEADLAQVKRFLSNVSKPAHAPPNPTPQPLPSPKTKQPNQSFGNYNGTKIVRFTFHGQICGAHPWTRMLIALAEQVYQLHSSEFQKVLELTGTKRPYFSRNQQGMRKSRPIGNSGYFAETDLTPGQIVYRCHALLAKFGYTPDDLQIETA